MSFQSGRVSYCRFLVTGKSPAAADQELLETLSRHSFTEMEIGRPDEVETGWITGEHILDTQFTYEKNIFGTPTPGGGGTMLLASMRMDTHRVPAEIKRAYKQLNEQSAAGASPTGFASKAEKAEARELTERQIHEDLASGKYRTSKAVPVLWDLPNNVLYCGAISATAAEQLAMLMRRTFDVNIEPLTSGALAGELMLKTGGRRDFEDLRPSPFTPPPPQATVDHEEVTIDGPQSLTIPAVKWAFASHNTRDFLGNEWLIWLWWITETAEGLVTINEASGRGDTADIAVHIDKVLDLECAWSAAGKVNIKGHAPTRLPEAAEALATGKWPRKATFILADTGDGAQWELTIQSDRMHITAALLPPVDDPDSDSPRELIEARLNLITRLADVIDGLYECFIAERAASTWATRRETIRKWITGRRRGKHTVKDESTEYHVPSDEAVIGRI